MRPRALAAAGTGEAADRRIRQVATTEPLAPLAILPCMTAVTPKVLGLLLCSALVACAAPGDSDPGMPSVGPGGITLVTFTPSQDPLPVASGPMARPLSFTATLRLDRRPDGTTPTITLATLSYQTQVLGQLR